MTGECSGGSTDCPAMTNGGTLITRRVSFEAALFRSREATLADSLGRKRKESLEVVLLAAKRRQHSA